MFIIIGLAIVGAVLGFIYLSNKIKSDELITSDKDPVSAYVRQCLAETAKEGFVYARIIQGYAKLKDGMETPNFYPEIKYN